jgi:hypothetical protein
MILRLASSVTIALSLFACASAAEKYPLRWVYVSRGLHRDQDVEDIRGIVKTAAGHGLNGMVLAAGLDRLDLQPKEYFQRLESVKRICDDAHVEIIPIIFSVGYGGSVLAHDRNLAAGLPVTDVPLVVHGGEARLEDRRASCQLAKAAPDGTLPRSSGKLAACPTFANGGFEEHRGNRAAGFQFHDRPGEVSFIDTEVFHEGKASLRFEGFGRYQHGHARVMQELAVRPRRCYRVTCWVKTEGLKPERGFRLQVYGGDRPIAGCQPRLPETSDWRKVTLGFNSLGHDKVRLYAGLWGGRGGRFWVDDFRIEEVALLNILRRPGTPLLVRDAKTGTVYEEGRDFLPVADRRLNFRFDHDGPPLLLAPGSRIRDGQALLASYYHGVAVGRGQVSVCMSEPKLYAIWQRQAELIQKHLAPKRYLLSMDEIREGGSCEACTKRKMTMGEILGDCITRQVQILRRVNPQAEVFCWSDMLDPNHNAHGDYYLVQGDFTGSWKHVPKDLRIVCWYYQKRKASLAHFSGLGFQTLAGAYYDGGTLENPKGWLEALAHTPGALGIMYTTWQNKYALLGPFGDLVSKR